MAGSTRLRSSELTVETFERLQAPVDLWVEAVHQRIDAVEEQADDGGVKKPNWSGRVLSP